ncbi:MAG: histone deacetylase [Desulfarculaceae bacterium]|nr:histone deacetylase [Desulfarculaceae bacterium]MCF8046278.1 histone deacetylase [Desulfarculaceae bacterium]MCF8066149.1 histone deacetylase [Desulfarculaceae bacterium]MCF8097500.1 histone deacetylase [Desulfarculaceae bacterium]MCF8120939.1 histone deacetylase [Desulfarculaceae bacterium]
MLPPLNIGIIRDDRFLNHQTGLSHPEAPQRLSVVHRMLDYDFAAAFDERPAEPATLEQVEALHTPDYIRMVIATARRRFTNLAADTTASSESCYTAFLAAGACIRGAREALAGDYQAALALVRPPGHHAQPAKAEGFCILNNLGITALELLRQGLKRILIVDWDLHHGNGLQKVFYDSPEVFYFSSHHLQSYPRTGDWEEAGAGAGEGYTLNLCLPPGADDNDVVELYRQLLPSVVERYQPQVILVAAGFDGHVDDPLSNLAMTAAGFGALGQLVADLGPRGCGVPLLLALEGGYDPTDLAECLRQVLLAWQGDPTMLERASSDRGAEWAERARAAHRRYGVWID